MPPHDSAPDPEVLYQLPGRDPMAPGGEAPAEFRRSTGLAYVARIAMDDPALTVDGERMKPEADVALPQRPRRDCTG